MDKPLKENIYNVCRIITLILGKTKTKRERQEIMDREQLEYYRELLLQEKRELEEAVARLTGEQELGLKDSTGELSSYDNHPADQGDNTYEREKDLGIKDNAVVILNQIEKALQLIESGNYGYCHNCGRQIPQARLEMVPYTLSCRRCREVEEGDESIRERPVEEESLESAFGGYGNGTGDEGGENAWEDVARYGTSSNEEE